MQQQLLQGAGGRGLLPASQLAAQQALPLLLPTWSRCCCCWLLLILHQLLLPAAWNCCCCMQLALLLLLLSLRPSGRLSPLQQGCRSHPISCCMCACLPPRLLLKQQLHRGRRLLEHTSTTKQSLQGLQHLLGPCVPATHRAG
jgi:hypothetical protein